MELSELAEILHHDRCSCVIYSHGTLKRCYERGVKDLLHLLKEEPEILSDAMIADKVIGKGAAALMVLGGVKTVYADVVSRPALEMLTDGRVPVKYGTCVPNIINRAGTGVCPVETLCLNCATAAECLPLIEKFSAAQK